jgi:hypothetical protein
MTKRFKDVDELRALLVDDDAHSLLGYLIEIQKDAQCTHIAIEALGGILFGCEKLRQEIASGKVPEPDNRFMQSMLQAHELILAQLVGHSTL